MTSKATLEALDALHGALAAEMASNLKDGEKVVAKDAEGNPQVLRVGVSAAMVGQIRQFLKDNNIEVDKTHGAKRFANIVENLPFPGEDDTTTPAATH
jgi:hypothetical protein